MSWNLIIGHDRPIKILKEAIARSKVAHAYLFHGPDAIGKAKTAMVFAKTLQCETPDRKEACETCRSCLAVTSGSHPDVFVIGPEGRQIKIDQIRGLQNDLVFKPLSGPRKILVLNEADTMNAEAANCFLKTLEEPPDHSLLILVTSRPHFLPSTILSRCQQIRFDPAPAELLARHLVDNRKITEAQAVVLAALSLGHTGEALSADYTEITAARDEAFSLLDPAALRDLNRLFENAHSFSSEPDLWMKTLDWIQIWLRDALILRFGSLPARTVNVDRQRQLSDDSRLLPTRILLRAFSRIEAIRRSVNRNLNRTLALESLLLELRQPLIEADP